MAPGSEKMEGQIFDSNKISLLTAIREQGYNAADLGTLPDKYVYYHDYLKNILQPHGSSSN